MNRFAAIGVNIVLVVTCILTCGDIIYKFASSRAADAARIERSKNSGPREGSTIALAGQDWSRARKGTLLFGISKDCHFCTQSGPFFKRVVATAGSDVAMIALAPDPAEQTRQYLSGLGVAIPDVRQISLSAVGVRATPTLMFVNRSGVVEKVWVGTVTGENQQEALDFISGRSRAASQVKGG
jgi:hypothetical protein